MTSLFVELPWSRKAMSEGGSSASASPAEFANDCCRDAERDSSRSLFRFRREDGLPHAL